MTSTEHESEQARQLRDGVSEVQMDLPKFDPRPAALAHAVAHARARTLAATERLFRVPTMQELAQQTGQVGDTTIRDPRHQPDHVKGLRSGR